MIAKIETQTKFTTRMARFEDLDAVIELLNAYSQNLFGTRSFKAEDLGAEWKLDNYSPETHIRIAENGQKDLAGYMEFWDLTRPLVLMQGWLRIHPNASTRDLAPTLLSWCEERALQRLSDSPDGARVALRIAVPLKDTQQVLALKQAGYESIRRFWRMHIDFTEPLPLPQWPAGIHVRTMQPGEEPKAITALRAAFHDHWGHVDVPFEEELARWLHFMKSGDWFDPSLWFFAMDGDEIAGFSYCKNHLEGEPNLGWVNQLGVLRPWRNRGLAYALLLHSLGELQRRGRSSAALGVDASSLTGATRLYEKAGMRPDERYTMDVYEKELRPGEDLTTH